MADRVNPLSPEVNPIWNLPNVARVQENLLLERVYRPLWSQINLAFEKTPFMPDQDDPVEYDERIFNQIEQKDDETEFVKAQIAETRQILTNRYHSDKELMFKQQSSYPRALFEKNWRNVIIYRDRNLRPQPTYFEHETRALVEKYMEFWKPAQIKSYENNKTRILNMLEKVDEIQAWDIDATDDAILAEIPMKFFKDEQMVMKKIGRNRRMEYYVVNRVDKLSKTDASDEEIFNQIQVQEWQRPFLSQRIKANRNGRFLDARRRQALARDSDEPLPNYSFPTNTNFNIQKHKTAFMSM